MSTTTGSVRGRVEAARVPFTPAQLAVGLLLVAAVGFTLLFLQEPVVHDGLHHFRHGAGITCH